MPVDRDQPRGHGGQIHERGIDRVHARARYQSDVERHGTGGPGAALAGRRPTRRLFGGGELGFRQSIESDHQILGLGEELGLVLRRDGQ